MPDALEHQSWFSRSGADRLSLFAGIPYLVSREVRLAPRGQGGTLIIWLASYPRSGNTLFRIILNEMGLGPTYSLHEDRPFQASGLRELIGHKTVQRSELPRMQESAAIFFVKTHEMPGRDSYPAIYIVRDGRDAAVSFAHYLRDVEGSDKPLQHLLAQLIIGEYKNLPRWDRHVRAWRTRPGRTEVVRFEELVEDPVELVASTLRNLGVPCPHMPRRNWDFESLRKEHPRFFRKGQSGGWSDTMPASLERQFWRWNHRAMQYCKLTPAAESRPRPRAKLGSVDAKSIGIRMEVHPEAILDGVCMPPHAGNPEMEDFHFFTSLVSQRKPNHVLEFGTAQGNSTANVCRFSNATVVTVNAVPERTSGTSRTFDLNEEEIGRVYRDFNFGLRVRQFYADSLDFCAQAASEIAQYDLVIIDACHDYEYVINDFLSSYELVSEQGCVIFHDTHPNQADHIAGSWKACCLLNDAGFDIVHVRGTWWAYWSPASQSRNLSTSAIDVLDALVEKTRLLRDSEERLSRAERKLNRVRNFPGYRLLRAMRSRLLRDA